ncbi:Zn-ribbon domain-containing OB-fold protein, partial [Mycobacterium timonense]
GGAGASPRYVCAHCDRPARVDTEASGRGSIYSYTVTTRGILEYANAGSYVLAMVELDEGPKMITNIIDCDPNALSIGQRVEVVFCDTGGDGALPRFRPADPGL